MTHKEIFLNELKFDFKKKVQFGIKIAYHLPLEEYEKMMQMTEAEADLYLAKYPEANIATKRQLVQANLFDKDIDAIINLWNEYCKENKDDDYYVHYNEKAYFDEYFAESAMEAVKTVFWGNYNIGDGYFYFKYNKIQTFNSLFHEECPIDRKKLIDWILKEFN